MKKNMGTLDRLIRILLAALIVVMYFTEVITGALGVILLILAAVFLLTGLFSFCPLYVPFGIKTFREKKKDL